MSGLSSSDAVTLTPQVSDPPPPPPIPSAISAAIAKFRPTPKEVISGIAPHVFDERRRRRRRSHSPRPTGHYTQHKRDGAGAGAKSSSSPLRFSAVMTVDSEGSLIFLDQTVTEHRHHHSQYQHQAEVKATKDSRPSQDCGSSPARDTNPQPIIEISGKIDKSRPRGFRIDSIRIFKSIAGKLKPASSQAKPLCSP